MTLSSSSVTVTVLSSKLIGSGRSGRCDRKFIRRPRPPGQVYRCRRLGKRLKHWAEGFSLTMGVTEPIGSRHGYAMERRCACKSIRTNERIFCPSKPAKLVCPIAHVIARVRNAGENYVKKGENNNKRLVTPQNLSSEAGVTCDLSSSSRGL